MASALLSSALKRSTISTTLFTRTLRPKTPFTTATSRRSFSSSGTSSSNKSKPNFSSTRTGSSSGGGGIPGTNPSEKFMAETDMDSKNYNKTEKLEDEYGFITETTMTEDELKAAMEARRPYSYLMVIRQFGVVKLVKKVTLEFLTMGFARCV